MTDKVDEFLTRIGFTEEDIVEFYRRQPDGVFNGNPHYGVDHLYAMPDEDKISAFSIGEDTPVETYWEKAWILEHHTLRNSNFDIYKDRWYKIFQSRYRLSEFKFTKSRRRVLKKNSDLKTVIRPFEISGEKSVLFNAHHQQQLGTPPRKTLYEIFYDHADYLATLMELSVFKDEKLIACSVFEVAATAIYSRVAFWDTNEANRSLGTLTFLLEIQYALSKHLQFCYFGIFYAQNPNYHYKTRFGGFELYDWDNEAWVPFGEPRIKEMLKQKLPRRTN